MGTVLEPPVFRFCHGTSARKAEFIRKHGLDQELAKAHQRGSTRPGSFHVLEHPAGLQLAYEFALRHEPPHLILVGELPLGVFLAMRQARGVVVEQLIGTEPNDPPQVVFFPQTYDDFNKHVSWLPPIKPSRR